MASRKIFKLIKLKLLWALVATPTVIALERKCCVVLSF